MHTVCTLYVLYYICYIHTVFSIMPFLKIDTMRTSDCALVVLSISLLYGSERAQTKNIFIRIFFLYYSHKHTLTQMALDCWFILLFFFILYIFWFAFNYIILSIFIYLWSLTCIGAHTLLLESKEFLHMLWLE